MLHQPSITPPKLYDLTTLQREANRYLGFTAKQTLDYVQKLYESKLVTYPRTDSQYLTDDMRDTVSALADGLKDKLSVRCVSDFDGMIDNKKVTDHHAMLPTVSSFKADVSEKSCGG